MRDFIPQIEPWIDNSELKELKRVIDSTFVTENKLTKEFENMIKELTGSRYAIAITNGTAALFCCLKALDIGPGDEVIVPNMTFVATSNAVLMAGAKPVLCEITPDTLCLDPSNLQQLISPNTKAIIPVHLYGQSCDMERICKIAQENNIKIVEDAAQGVGVTFNNKHVGTFGDLGILSFYGNKTITCGEGGIILTDSKHLRDLCYRLKNHGRIQKGTFKHDYIGFNFSFTEMQAAIGISQMKKLPLIIDRKKKIHDRYYTELSKISDKLCPIFLDQRTNPVWWFTSFLTENKDSLQEYLLKMGIQTRDFFYPLHKQPCYDKMCFEGNFSISERVYHQGISLPSSYGLSEKEQDYIIDCIYRFYG
jgi:perosamine synthetase